jgi:heme oxygenase
MITGASAGGVLRQALQRATRHAHHRINHHLLVVPLVCGELTAARYGGILSALYALHAPVEEAITRFFPAPEDSPPRRSRRLAVDIKRLGLTVPGDGALWEGRSPTSPSEYVGMRYVIEGSALGGRVIAAQLSQRLPEQCRNAMLFFDGRADTGE